MTITPIVKIVNNQVKAFVRLWTDIACYKEQSYLVLLWTNQTSAFNKIHILDVIQAFGAVFPSCPTLLLMIVCCLIIICNPFTIIESVPIYILDCLPEKEVLFYPLLPFLKNNQIC
jgi:hypothetical protein